MRVFSVRRRARELYRETESARKREEERHSQLHVSITVYLWHGYTLSYTSSMHSSFWSVESSVDYYFHPAIDRCKQHFSEYSSYTVTVNLLRNLSGRRTERIHGQFSSRTVHGSFDIGVKGILKMGMWDTLPLWIGINFLQQQLTTPNN